MADPPVGGAACGRSKGSLHFGRDGSRGVAWAALLLVLVFLAAVYDGIVEAAGGFLLLL